MLVRGYFFWRLPVCSCSAGAVGCFSAVKSVLAVGTGSEHLIFFKCNGFFQDLKVPVCGSQHMDNQVGCEQALEGLLGCLRKKAAFSTSQITRFTRGMSSSLLAGLESMGWPRVEDSGAQAGRRVFIPSSLAHPCGRILTASPAPLFLHTQNNINV